MPKRKLTEEERAERKAIRRAKRQRTWSTIKEAISKLVQAAEFLFPEQGAGALRKQWVEKAVQFIKTPAGDVIEAAVLNYLIELAVEELTEEE